MANIQSLRPYQQAARDSIHAQWEGPSAHVAGAAHRNRQDHRIRLRCR